jgi:MarR family transcriptional regulator, organic hydroperoxide resistance regulator
LNNRKDKNMPDTSQSLQKSSEILPARVWFRTLRLMARAQVKIGLRLKIIGLSIPQFDVLSTLTEQEGLSQRALADRLYVTKGNVSGLIDRLEQAGLVERRAITGDKRSHGLYLTAIGLEAARKGIDIQKAFIVETLGQINEDNLLEMDRLSALWRDKLRNVD